MNSKTAKRTAAVLLLLLVAALPAAAKPRETLRVGHDYWVGYAAVFIAAEEGFYKEAGLDVELIAFPGPGDSLPPLIAGNLDLCLTTLHNIAMMAGSQDTPISLVYLLDSSDGADAVVARKDIAGVADLKGKKVAVTLNEINHVLLTLALDSVGLTEDDVTLVNLDGTEAGTAFLAGSVDAACTWEPWISRAQADGSGHVIFSSADAKDTFINVVCATDAVQQDRGPAIEAFIAATDRGAAFLENHPEDGAAIVGRKLEAPAADITEMLTTDRILNLEDSQTLMGPGGQIASTLGTIVEFLRERDLLARPVDPASLQNAAFVGAAR